MYLLWTLLAQMIDLVAPYSQLISTTLDFTQSQKTSEQIYFDELINFYTNSTILNRLHNQLEQLDRLIDKTNRIRTRYRRDKKMLKKLYDFYNNDFLSEKLLETLTTFEEKLQAAHVDLDSDRRLANSFITANNIVLGMPFIVNDVNEKLAPNLPDYVQKHHLKTIRKPFESKHQIPQPPSGSNAIPPFAILGQHVAGIGHFNLKNYQANPRKIPLIIKYNKNYFPSLPLLLVAKSLNHHNDEIEVQLGKGVRIDQWQVNTDSTLHTWLFFISRPH